MKNILCPLAALFLLIAAPVYAQDQEAEKAPVDYATQQKLTSEHSVEELQLLVTPLTLEQLRTEADEWQN